MKKIIIPPTPERPEFTKEDLKKIVDNASKDKYLRKAIRILAKK